jgi:hypothetical protein
MYQLRVETRRRRDDVKVVRMHKNCLASAIEAAANLMLFKVADEDANYTMSIEVYNSDAITEVYIEC